MERKELIAALRQLKEQEAGRKYCVFSINIYELACELLNYFEKEFIVKEAKKPTIRTYKNDKKYFCGECGYQLAKSWNVCPRCATKIKSEKKGKNYE